MMKIGIIIHSQSGHTLAAASKLQEKLTAAGHKATIEQITPAERAYPGIKSLRLETRPDIASYDGLVFACPVWAFSVSPVLETYLAELKTLKGKKIAGFVTMGFPFAWMGGTHAIAKLKQICDVKGGTVLETAIIGRSGHDEKALHQMVEKLSGVF